MNIALVYSSNSGSTFLAGKIIAKILSSGHKVTLKKAEEMTAKKIKDFDLVVFGSPSWSVEGKQSMPHEFMLNLLKNIESTDFVPKRYAVYGCGDRSYTVFCGAVDHIDQFLRKTGANSPVNTLKIHAFYANEPENKKLIEKWAKELLTKINKKAV